MTELLKNIWYMGGWSHEVTDTPMSRRLLGMSILFYRKADGVIAALRDRCPHRFAPLSKGKIIDDCIQCPYHGLMFDASGQCVKAPLEERAPRAVRVGSFPVVERDHIIWFWPGDPDAINPSLIPDFSRLSDPEWKHVFGLTHVHAHYELETDNLMDLTHLETVHPAFAGLLTPKSQFKATRIGNTVQADWFSASTNNPAITEHGAFPTKGGLVDNWMEMRWDPPGSMYLEVATTRAGEPREAGYTTPSFHILTPETDASTLYFWAASLRAHEQVPLEFFRQMFSDTFEHEDKPMIEQVATAMEGKTDLLAMKPLLLRSDAGSVLARRVLAELIGRERKQATAALAAE